MTYYTIYKVTNKINGKIYIGSHKTKNLDDGYMGSGKYLTHALQKYGLENFTKEILFIFDNPKDMYAKEAEIVNDEFLTEENTYNLKRGGFGGWDYVNETVDFVARNTKASQNGNNHNKRSSSVRHCWTNGCYTDREVSEKFTISARTSFLGKSHTEETKKKIGQKNSSYQIGSGNSQYGTRWIHSISLQLSKKIRKKDPLPEGWVEGRKIKF
jgi:group I intron endonuclease